MAMEKNYVMHDISKCQVTAVGFHPLRREIVAGFEDGSMKWWEQDSGKLQLTCHEHRGWVTNFIFIPQKKVFLSCAHDGIIVVWGSGGNVLEKINVGDPIYSIAQNVRRGQLVCGVSRAVVLYSLDFDPKATSIIDKSSKPYYSREHSDIVSCVLCHESRVYTAGYDSKMCIYDTFPGKLAMIKIYQNNYAHDAGITCMILISDNENNRWIVTGSFDSSIKVWSQDGKLRQRLSTCFYDTITSLVYVPRTRVVWVASLGQTPILFDPKSGENVSEFLPQFESDSASGNIESYYNQIIKLGYSSESGQLIGSTSRRHLIVWKYNSAGCISALRINTPVESITYTSKAPLLYFSGTSDGCAFKWERLQSSQFMYSHEVLPRKESLEKQESILMNRGELSDVVSNMYLNLTTASGRPSLPSRVTQSKNLALVSTIYVEHLDMLVLASEDGNVYVWGFDYEVVDALRYIGARKKSSSVADDRRYNLFKSTVLHAHNSLDDEALMETSKPSTPAPADQQKAVYQTKQQMEDSVTNRVAGFICKNVLIGHSSCVSAMVVINNSELYDTTFLLTGGWDRRLLMWNLDSDGKYYDQLRYPDSKFGCIPDGTSQDGGMYACGGSILALEYCPKRNEIAYASSDNLIYIRHFSNDGSLMHLACTLEGHEQEVTAIKWNPIYDKWVTSSEDGTIKIWAEDGSACEETLITQGLVTAICIDQVNGSIVAAVDNLVKVYDMETTNLVQQNRGHTENIKCIMHIVELSQYMSGSYDKSMRIWNSYRKPVKKIKKK